LILSFTNVGMRTVTVTNFRLVVRPYMLRRALVFVFPYLDPKLGPLCSKVPCKLSDREEGHIFFKKTFFQELENNEQFLFHPNALIAWWRIHSFAVEIKTTVGKYFITTVRWSVRRAIWGQYNQRQKVEGAA
jgi:hypothetical protein